MRIVFMGTPDFSVPCLQALIDDGHDVCAVFTQPDKPKGRHGVLTPPPVKELALKYDIPVYQPKTLKTDEAKELFKSLNADLSRRLRKDTSRRVYPCAEVRLHQYARFSAPETARRGTHPVVYNHWRKAHRSHIHADGRGTRYRRYAYLKER